MNDLQIAVIGGPSADPIKNAITRRPGMALCAEATGRDSAATIFRSRGVQAVAIYTGADSAPGLCEAALQSGLHVLCIGPPARNIEDIMRIRRAEGASQAKIRFDMPLRAHASVTSALSLAASGVLGNLLTVRAVYAAADGQPGVLMHRGFHMLDLLHGFCGVFEEVLGMVEQAPGEERNGFVLMRTNRGVIAQLHASSTSHRHSFRLEAGFEEGYLWLDGLRSAGKDFDPEMLIIGRGQRGRDGFAVPNPDEDIHEMTETPSKDDTLQNFADLIAGGQGGWLATTKQVFDAINAVQRVYAMDHDWATAR